MKTRLKELREDHDLTQEQCAKIAYISKNSYIRYEKGERVPPLDIIVMYAKYYNTSIDYIACLTDTNQNLF
ncbi:MAG: helix-turn-helix transcriptional regulator [Clostridia bacterium]|jgi:transcriptional regulator with XRE-family HTH domain|nr:helix-turn-helix transcriptional regulator [Clostridia bacterium]